MNPPVLAEAVRPSRLPRIAAPVRRVPALQERRVDSSADLGTLQGPVQTGSCPEDLPPLHGHHAVVLAVLVHRREVQPFGQALLGAVRGRPGQFGAGTTGTAKAFSIADAYAGASSLVISSGGSPPSRCFTSVTMASAFSIERDPGITAKTSRCSGS